MSLNVDHHTSAFLEALSLNLSILALTWTFLCVQIFVLLSDSVFLPPPLSILLSYIQYDSPVCSLRIEVHRKTETNLIAFVCGGSRELRLTEGDWLVVFALTKKQ